MTVRQKTFSAIALANTFLLCLVYAAAQTFLLGQAAGTRAAGHNQDLRGQFFLAVAILVAEISFLVILWIVLHRTVFSRLGALDRAVAQVASGDRISSRMNSDGVDEFSSLAFSISGILRIRSANARTKTDDGGTPPGLHEPSSRNRLPQ